jgi:heme-degrading monooxygenase HmoA
MFVRMVFSRVKPNQTSHFNETFERKVLPLLRKQKGFREAITLTTPGSNEVVGISFWDRKEDAESYNSSVYPEVVKELTPLTEGTPRVQTHQVLHSTIQNITAAKTAA